MLAEEISPHGSTSNWVIRLRKGITFHDGKPLTADDVIFTIRRIVSGKLTGATPLGPIDLKGLKALDKLTVQVPMTSPYGSFTDQLAYWYYLYIVPVGFNPAKPNGTGAFKYQSFTPGQRSVFTRNENYWKSGLPYVDSVTIIDFSDSASLQNALTTGVIHGAGALEGPQLAALAAAGSVRTVKSHTGAITPFTMRVDKAPFNDVNVRQAMRLLVDRQQLIDSALDGAGTVGADVSSPYDPNYDTSLHRVQDIAQAKSLLKKAGQEDLKVQLVTSAVATGTVSMATVLAQQAQAAGVTISLKTVDPDTFFGPNYLQWTFSQDFYNYSPYLSQVAESLLPASPFNETHWSLPRYGQPVPAGERDRRPGGAQGDRARDAADRLHPGRVHHPGLHRRARCLQYEDHRIRGRPGGPAAVRFQLRAVLVHLTGERISRCNPRCLRPASGSPRDRPSWAMGGSCCVTATPVSCWSMTTAPSPPTRAPEGRPGARCPARTGPST